MRDWVFLLGGLIVWTLHFFALYGAASLFPGSDVARWLTLAATIPAIAADAYLLWVAAGKRSVLLDGTLDTWAAHVAAIGAIVSLIAVLWQALPALIV